MKGKKALYAIESTVSGVVELTNINQNFDNQAKGVNCSL